VMIRGGRVKDLPGRALPHHPGHAGRRGRGTSASIALQYGAKRPKRAAT